MNHSTPICVQKTHKYTTQGDYKRFLLSFLFFFYFFAQGKHQRPPPTTTTTMQAALQFCGERKIKMNEMLVVVDVPRPDDNNSQRNGGYGGRETC